MAAAGVKIFNKLPVIVVLGATATGKSRLAIQLARKFNGEVISTDSMQIYQGLNIITNKVSEEEQLQCPHHMISFLSPLDQKYSVVDFRNTALPLINSLLERNVIPILVGGTNYYIEALLWDYLIPKMDATNVSSAEQTSDLSPIEGSTNRPVDDEEVDSMALHQKLRDIDPESAKEIHPNNRRKVLRALQVYHQLGEKKSKLLREQHGGHDGAFSGRLRFAKTCCLWLQCDKEVLNKRITDRVNLMIEQGLIQELEDFHEKYNQHRMAENQSPDYTKGIFQCIGFKEFHEYLILSKTEKDSKRGQKMFKDAVADLQRVTCRYAKKQLKWVRNRFLKRTGVDVTPLYPLDGTDPDQWNCNVYSPAVAIVEALTKGDTPVTEPVESQREDSRDEFIYEVCEVCGGRVFVTASQWQAHLKSRKHRTLVGIQRNTPTVAPRPESTGYDVDTQ